MKSRRILAYTVGNNVRVTLQTALRVTVGLLIASKVPNNQGLVATARKQHVGAMRNGSQNQSHSEFRFFFFFFF